MNAKRLLKDKSNNFFKFDIDCFLCTSCVWRKELAGWMLDYNNELFACMLKVYVAVSTIKL